MIFKSRLFRLTLFPYAIKNSRVVAILVNYIE